MKVLIAFLLIAPLLAGCATARFGSGVPCNRAPLPCFCEPCVGPFTLFKM